jgi:lipoprotein-releasing system permease protein
MGSIPKISTFTIIGIIDTGLYQYDSSLVILPFAIAQSFFNYNNNAQKIDIFTKNPQEASNIKYQISNMISKNLYIETWEDSNGYLINALKVEENVMFLILSLVILIATFNIVSGLIMLVRSKTKEIAILKTMGLSSSSIIKIFLLIGMRIGFLGTFFGFIIGVVFSYNIERIRKVLEYFLKTNLFSEEVYFLSKLPSKVDMYQVAIIVLIALFFVIISSVYPALRASRIVPTEGLKYD